MEIEKMEVEALFDVYQKHIQSKKIISKRRNKIFLKNIQGSLISLYIGGALKIWEGRHWVILPEEEEAIYLYYDLVQLLGEEQVLFFPLDTTKMGTSQKKKVFEDVSYEILRTQVLETWHKMGKGIVVCYADALTKGVPTRLDIERTSLRIENGMEINYETFIEDLYNYGFERVDFVYAPGQYAVRGGIIDVFSYTSESPYRIDFFGDEVNSIRKFDIETQLSKESVEYFYVANKIKEDEGLIAWYDFVGSEGNITLWIKDKSQTLRKIREKIGEKNEEWIGKMTERLAHWSCVEWGVSMGMERDGGDEYTFVENNAEPQPTFLKNFDLLSENLLRYLVRGYQIYVMSDSVKQTDRLRSIFEERGEKITFSPIHKTLHEGWIDHEMKLCVYTDHQIFDRFHRYTLKTDKVRQGKVAKILKDLGSMNKGDYIVHIDHGIGQFDGLQTIDNNGHPQEVVKLVYKDGDIVFVSIHALHKISKYKGKEGEPPRINKIGTGAWQNLKERTKRKVKDIARDLIQLYAKRLKEKGFAYSPDSYLQQELEASFLYEDTPDQALTTQAIKNDMERERPMDRLVCGDVGFGKTEVAIRAAFKAVTDGKQVAVLVPTTVLAFQHYKTFCNRLSKFPCRIAYLSRAKSTTEAKEIIKELKEGKIDILIGTHRLIAKDVTFKDLGLLIIDEEQKFGVSVKEKLKTVKVNVDTLTLTATPIPRTLQFSLMGARDLSVMRTPPPNRYPILTEVEVFDEEVIREAIEREMSRNGQVFFVHNRVQSLNVIQNLIQRVVPQARVAVAHGQMESAKMEKIVLDFVNYEYDVLLATTIIESGIDIPNANTIIINQAQSYGLSDLHQLRGRVGRSNRKAYCYLLIPPIESLTKEARMRIEAISNFSGLGSGFNIAMQDLDIRGAGNMLGSEQSGFIVDLGYETYQKILQEAVEELKEEEFSDLEVQEDVQVQECVMESDMELLFPQEYIESASERINLYRELDGISNDEELKKFAERLRDRFGELPKVGQDLIESVHLRIMAAQSGVEKLVLKRGRLTLHFTDQRHTNFYQSDVFDRVLNYAGLFPSRCKMKELDGHGVMMIDGVKNIDGATEILRYIKS